MEAIYNVELAQRLAEKYQVIEVGNHGSLFADEDVKNIHSFANETNVSEFAWLIDSADVFVGPPSGGMHLANSLSVPSVIIHGGYEAPEGYNYELVTPLYNPVECAPCWLTTQCPYNLKCMDGISVANVLEAVDATFERHASAPK